MADKEQCDMDNGLPASMVDKVPSADPNTTPVTWKNRRKMAWYSFWIFIAITVSVLFMMHYGTAAPDEKKLEQIVNIYFYFCSVIGAIILGYMGFTTLPWLGRRG